MTREPAHHRDFGVRLGAFLYCFVTGLGVGAFVSHPYIGAIAGGALGLPIALWLAPALLRDWRD